MRTPTKKIKQKFYRLREPWSKYTPILSNETELRGPNNHAFGLLKLGQALAQPKILPKFLFPANRENLPDFMPFSSVFLVSGRFKQIIANLDEKSGLFFETHTSWRDEHPEYWLMSVTAIVDAVDERNSTVERHVFED